MEKIKKFELAIQNSDLESDKNTIGQLREKKLHSVLKYYYCSDSQYHEIRTGRYVADIKVNDDITEIQTSSFYSMKKKLDYYLTYPEVTVTIVHPIAYNKWICWVDTKTGEVSAKRKSPKKGSIYDILPELYSLKDYVFREGISFRVCLIDLIEYKTTDPTDPTKKRRYSRKGKSSKIDREPIALIDDILFDDFDDYHKFVPHSLPAEFTKKEWDKATKLSPKNSGLALLFLRQIGIVEQVGKRGRAYLYSRTQ